MSKFEAGEEIRKGELVAVDANGRLVRADDRDDAMGIADNGACGGRAVRVWLDPSTTFVVPASETDAIEGYGPK